MVKRKFVCRSCGCKFEKPVMGREEAREKGLSLGPIICPDCRSRNVEGR